MSALAMPLMVRRPGERTVERHSMDEAAFLAFYEATAGSLRGYLLRSCGNEALADDIVQESYLRLLRAKFEPKSEAHRKNYLFTIATNLLRDHFRSRKHLEVELPELSSPAEHDQAFQMRHDVRETLAELKPRDRQLLWLGHVERFSHKEIADIMEIGAGSVRLMLFRARKRLAEKLESKGIGPEVIA